MEGGDLGYPVALGLEGGEELDVEGVALDGEEGDYCSEGLGAECFGSCLRVGYGYA